jgi:tetratricopeptide (TPR) repeat protein
LRARLQIFESRYSLYRFGGAKATLATVEAELGPPAMEPGSEPGSREAVYLLPGCAGRVLINAEGVAWTAKFANLPSPPAPNAAMLDQLLDIDEQIRNDAARMEQLASARDELIRHVAVLQPVPPSSGADCVKVLSFHPLDAADYLRRAWCRHVAGLLDEAIRDYTESLALEFQPVALQNRALAYFSQGQSASGLADLAKLRESQEPSAASNEAEDAGERAVIRVRGYYRKDGTYVAPYDRSVRVKK